MDMNTVIKRYAAGEIERDVLRSIFEGIGFSSVCTDILLRTADRSKEQYEQDESNNINRSLFQVPYSECISSLRKPSGSLGNE